MDRKWWRRIFKRIGISVLLICIVLLWNFCRNFDLFTEENYYSVQPVDNELDYVEMNADILVPPSAHEIYVYNSGFNEIIIYVRFSMNASDLQDFLASTHCQDELEIIEPDVRSGGLEWWRPDQAEILKVCFGREGPNRQTIQIDMSNPDLYIVYISNSVY